MNIYRSSQCAGLILLSNFAIATEGGSESLLSVPQDLAMGIKHQSYQFASIEDADAELAMDATSLVLPLGKYNFGSSFFVPTFSLDKTTFRFNNTDADNEDAYTIKTQLTLVTKSDEKWTRIIQVTPSLHSDLNVLDDEAFSLMGMALWRYQSTSESTWTMGVGINRLFGEYKPIPMVSYQYNVSDSVQFDLGFPITKAEYRWQNDWSTYVSVAPIGGNWRYESEEEKNLNISYSSWVAATGVRYQFKPTFWATLELGQSFSRQLELETGSSIDESLDVDDTPVIMLSIGLHP